MFAPKGEILIRNLEKGWCCPLEDRVIYLLRILIVYYLNLCMVGIVGLLR